jgi:hypothetical protein
MADDAALRRLWPGTRAGSPPGEIIGDDIVLVYPGVSSTFRVEVPLAYEPNEEPATDLH